MGGHRFRVAGSAAAGLLAALALVALAPACSPGGGGGGGRDGSTGGRDGGRWNRPEPPVRRGEDGGVIIADGAPVPDGAVTSPCGREPGQRCCPSRFPGEPGSCERGLRCVAESGVCKALPGAPCTGPADCDDGLGCDGRSGTCTVAEGGSCIRAEDCGRDSGLACLDGTCKPPPADCGRDGQPCCGETCVSGFGCSGGSCTRCGGEGQPCCDGVFSCDRGSDLVCQAGSCKRPTTCGAPGQPCCVSTPGGMPDSCSSRARCNPTSRTCEERPAPGSEGSDCGADGQPCCPGKQCDFGAICEPYLLNRCIGIGTVIDLLGFECGKEDQICCLPGLTCEGTLECDLLFCRSDCTSLSDACTSTDQCCQGTTTFCEAAPEQKRCCHPAGGSCEGHLDCCGWMLCEDGTCACQETGEDCVTDAECCPTMDAAGKEIPSVCRDGKCERGAGACLPVREGCDEGGDSCCAGLVCSTTRDQSAETPNRCCARAGTSCNGELDCCGRMVCDEGVCQCVSEGSRCISNEECCEGLECILGKCESVTSCNRLGDSCTSSRDCCGEVVCADSDPDPMVDDRICCTGKRRPCTTDNDCCGAMRCVYDEMAEEKLCQCQAPGQPCVNTSECCTGAACRDGTCVAT